MSRHPMPRLPMSGCCHFGKLLRLGLSLLGSQSICFLLVREIAPGFKCRFACRALRKANSHLHAHHQGTMRVAVVANPNFRFAVIVPASMCVAHLARNARVQEFLFDFDDFAVNR